MGISIIGSVSPVKSIQRGIASTSGDITITEVNVSKTIVNSFPTSASGTAQTSGTIAGATGTTSTSYTSGFNISAGGYSAGAGTSGVTGGILSGMTFNQNAMNSNSANISGNPQNISGGTTDITVETYGVYLKNSTTITATGPCRYEVVEYF